MIQKDIEYLRPHTFRHSFDISLFAGVMEKSSLPGLWKRRYNYIVHQ